MYLYDRDTQAMIMAYLTLELAVVYLNGEMHVFFIIQWIIPSKPFIWSSVS